MNNVLNTASEDGINYPVVFLFADGSKNGQLGAKQFMSSHKWAKKCLRFANLDSSGSGGKSMVFRVTDSSVLSEYDNAPHPYITVIGEEMMRLVPGYDTDFTVFSDKSYRNSTLPKYYLKGFDYGFYWDGYYYATKMDTYDNAIREGSIQQLGNNVLHQILKVTRNSDIMSVDGDADVESNFDTDQVYFDVLGGFYVHFSFQISQIIQGIIVCVDIILPIVLVIVDHIISLRYNDTSSVYQLFKKSITGLQARIMFLFLYLAGYILALGFGVLFAALVGAICDGIQPMNWYKDPVLAGFLFGLPTLLGMFLTQYGVHLIGNLAISGCGCFKLYRVSLKDKSECAHNENTAAQTLVYALDKERYLALTFFWGLLTAASLCTQLRSFYIVYFWSFCLSGMLICLLLCDRLIMWGYLIFFNKTRAKALEAAGATMEENLTDAGQDVDKRKKFLELRRKKKDDELSKDDEKFMGKFAKRRNLRHELALQLQSFTWRDFFHAIHYHQLYWVILMTLASWPPLVVTLDIFDRILHFLVPLMSHANYPVAGAMIGSVVGLFIFLMTISYMPIMHRAANFGKVMILTGGTLAIVIIIAIATSGWTSTTPRKIQFTQITKPGSAVTGEINVAPYLLYTANGTQTITYNKATSISAIAIESYDGNSVSGILSTFKYQYAKYTSSFYRESCGASTTGSSYKCEFLVKPDSTEQQMSQLAYDLALKTFEITNVVRTTDADYNRMTLNIKYTFNKAITQSLVSLSITGSNDTVQGFTLGSTDPNYGPALYYTEGTSSVYKYGMEFTESDYVIDIKWSTSASVPTISLATQVYQCDISSSPIITNFANLNDELQKYYLTPLGTGKCSMLTEQSTTNIKLN